jgi:hypothetical protein
MWPSATKFLARPLGVRSLISREACRELVSVRHRLGHDDPGEQSLLPGAVPSCAPPAAARVSRGAGEADRSERRGPRRGTGGPRKGPLPQVGLEHRRPRTPNPQRSCAADLRPEPAAAGACHADRRSGRSFRDRPTSRCRATSVAGSETASGQVVIAARVALGAPEAVAAVGAVLCASAELAAREALLSAADDGVRPTRARLRLSGGRRDGRTVERRNDSGGSAKNRRGHSEGRKATLHSGAP